MSTRDTVEKAKAAALRKVVRHYRHGVARILERAEWVLNKYPDSMGAAKNKAECDEMVAFNKAVFLKAKVDVQALHPDQMQVDLWGDLNED